MRCFSLFLGMVKYSSGEHGRCRSVVGRVDGIEGIVGWRGGTQQIGHQEERGYIDKVETEDWEVERKMWTRKSAGAERQSFRYIASLHLTDDATSPLLQSFQFDSGFLILSLEACQQILLHFILFLEGFEFSFGDSTFFAVIGRAARTLFT